MRDERYEECDRCEERFVGDDAIRSYLREHELPNGEVENVCIGCLPGGAIKRRTP